MVLAASLKKIATMTVPLYRRIESDVQLLDSLCQALDYTG
jgi:hypothetical protein